MAAWISRISRKNPDGTSWTPKPREKVCSAHFIERDFYKGHSRACLKPDAVPSVFPNYPTHKQLFSSRRKSPKKRSATDVCDCEPTPSTLSPSSTLKLDHGYTYPSAEAHLQTTKRKLDLSLEKQRKQASELKKVKKQVVRRDKRIEGLLQDIKKLKLIKDSDYDILDQNFDADTRTIIENELKHLCTSSNNHIYSEDLKSFAVSLHFYSAAAYEYVRKHLHLPHPNTLRKWASVHDVEPGFLKDVISGMKRQLGEDSNMADVAVMFDSMSLRKQVIYDQTLQKYVGHINQGHLQIASDDALASESLTFLAVGLKKFFKVPFGYFPIDEIDALQQAQLVKDGISLLSEAGFNVEAIVCDGSFTNQATATALGCDFKSSTLKVEIPHPDDPIKEISFLFDACHLLKNVRNCLGDLGIIRSRDGVVRWNFIVELHNLQLSSNLHLCNKLKGAHLDYAKNKMKVALAAQTLSSSVATAIDFLRDDLGLRQFFGSEPTSDAIRFINSLTDAAGKPLIQGKRKTGFVGFVVTLTSTKRIAERLLRNGYKFLLTYRLSQDHLETLFSRIRRKGGWNNNPNTLQFKFALRSLLMKNGVLSSLKGNCSPSPPDNPLLDVDGGEGNTKDKDKSEAFFQNILCNPGPYYQHVLHYIAGYIEKKLIEKLKCPHCISHLSAKEDSFSQFEQLTKRRNKGGLRLPHPDILVIVKKTDQILRTLLASAKDGPLRSVSKQTTLRTTIAVIESLGDCVFKMDHPNITHIESEDVHHVQNIKFITHLFCKMLFHHHGKLYTESYIQKDVCSVRHKLNKTVLFLH
ncbi:THAP domain-containing protein 9 [Elysia marginata]|uniref:THAP domain-containing protein 9 n=1 Tax=Elysia marginata TaxID=1093978 RepID=A0AAV4JXP6_9GAST|nr:THAP domain-containing protein 9 [Elysia marginata]